MSSDPPSFNMPRGGARQGPPAGPPPEDEPEAAPRLAEDAVVDLAEEIRGSQVFEVLEQLERELIGLVPVKTRIREVASLLLVDRMRRSYGLDSERPTLHMCFTGSPGTGKTTVAVRMAEVLHRLGYLGKGHLVAVTRDDLVGQYIGHTAPKTREVLKRAMGGVLFIDEAYYLFRQENERDYGQETIEILLQVMENQRDDIVVILAGYKDRMDTFFQSNPGMSSRIAHHIDFPDYSVDELMGIANLILERQRYRFSEDGESSFRELMERRMRQPRFANGRSVRNALERARLRQASRLVSAGGSVGRDDLMRIDGEDIRKSRLFDADELGSEEPAAQEPAAENGHRPS
jgi:probable Rubsico expression protein CbbX